MDMQTARADRAHVLPCALFLCSPPDGFHFCSENVPVRAPGAGGATHLDIKTSFNGRGVVRPVRWRPAYRSASTTMIRSRPMTSTSAILRALTIGALLATTACENAREPISPEFAP